MSKPKFTSVVEGLSASVPFVGPEAQERALGREFRARLGANENVFGPSPLAIEAMARAARDVWMYADPETHELKAALAAFHDVAPENIVVGEGIDGLLGYVCRMFVEPGARVVTSNGAYPTFNFHVAANGGTLETVPYRDDFEDIDGLFEAGSGARLIYLANPDNPMGTVYSASEIGAAIDRVPDGAVFLLDEAYCDFAPEVAALDVSRSNVIRFRTFSKAYGLAGARVGYAIAHAELASAFGKIRDHFGMSRISLAGAQAALADQGYLQDVIENVEKSRLRISAIVADNGLRALPSAANFVPVECGRDGAYSRSLLEALAERGVFVRMPFVAPQDRCIRISCGRPEDLDVLAAALPEALAAL